MSSHMPTIAAATTTGVTSVAATATAGGVGVGLGLLFAALSAVFNGSWAAPFKSPRVADASVHPAVFQLYVSLGVFLSSWLVLPLLRYNPVVMGEGEDTDVGTEFTFSPPGLIAGCLFVLAASGSVFAVDDVGMALAQGIWGGGAMIVSYLWGTAVFGETPSRLGFSIFGLVLLICGVVVVAFSGRIASLILGGRSRGGDDAMPLIPQLDDDLILEGDDDDQTDDPSSPARSGRYARGVLWAASVGLTGGSILVPLHYVPPAQQGLVFLPSFGIGALLLSPAVLAAHCLLSGGVVPPLHARDASVVGLGLLAGLVWNVGNACSIVAIPAVGYGVAYPLYQCAILVSGVWGIYVFREIREGGTIRVFWVGGAVLVLGAVVLSASQ